MGSSFLPPPTKRSISTSSEMLDSNTNVAAYSGGASSKRSKPPPAYLTVPAGHASFRLLCHESSVGGVIGKSGSVIKRIQQDTSSKIRVEMPPQASDDFRVILVVASSTVNKKVVLTTDGRDEAEEIEVSSAQEALLRVYERIIEVATETDGVPAPEGGTTIVRLLAGVSQAGSVIGKGGKVVEKIRKDTGCKIKVLRTEKLPACASPDDEIIEIEGEILAVKKGLLAVARCIQSCPPADKSRSTESRPLRTGPEDNLSDLCNVRMDVATQPSSILQPNPTSSINYASSGTLLSLESDIAQSLDTRMQQHEVVYKVLCSNDRIGGVIGKGGTIIKALQNETGASISVGNSIAGCDERLITVTAKEKPDSPYSSAQKAAILVFNRSVEAGIEKGLDLGAKGSQVSARLVVPSNQVGCLMGKGGTIISEMRKLTGAGIRIIGNDQGLECMSANDQIVQITGEFLNVQDALYNITGKLRDNIIPSKMSTSTGTKSNPSLVTDFSPYARARDISSVEFNSSAGVSHSLSRYTALTHSTNHRLSHNLDRPVSPRAFTTQAVGVNPRNSVDIGRGLTSVRGGLELGSGIRSAVVTNTSVEMIVPENVMGSVYGKSGGNLARLRQISGAQVTVRDPLPGTTDRVIVISGTPDETQAAQSLLHAFILTGST